MFTDVNMVFVFLISLVAAYIGRYYWRQRNTFRHAWSMPGPLALPYIGNLIDLQTFKSALFKDFLSYYTKYGGIYRVWAGHNLLVVITDPDMAETLLNMKTEIFPKPFFFEFFNAMFGRSIFFQGDYHAWKANRRVLNRVFQSGAITKATSCLYEKALSLSDELGAGYPSAQRVDEALYSWNCDVITHAVIGLKFRPTEIELICYVNKQFFKLFRESVKSITVQINFLQKFTAFHTRKSILETVTRLGMINFFVSGRSQHRDAKLDDVKLADLQEELGASHLDELGLFNVAGIETLTTACSAIMFLLSMHPHAQAKTHKELVAVMGEDFRQEPTPSQLEDLKYLDMVIKEALRLYPPGYVAPRRAMQNVNIGNYTIPKGASIMINISGIHRNPQHFSDPDQFIPERFSPEQSTKRPRNCFLPFGAGPRKCIGQKFALIHLKLIFSVLLRRFELLPSDKYDRIEDCVTAFRFVIEFKHGCFVRLKARGSPNELVTRNLA